MNYALYLYVNHFFGCKTLSLFSGANFERICWGRFVGLPLALSGWPTPWPTRRKSWVDTVENLGSNAVLWWREKGYKRRYGADFLHSTLFVISRSGVRVRSPAPNWAVRPRPRAGPPSLAGVEGLEPSARGFGVDVEKTWEDIQQPVFRAVEPFVFPKSTPQKILMIYWWCWIFSVLKKGFFHLLVWKNSQKTT